MERARDKDDAAGVSRGEGETDKRSGGGEIKREPRKNAESEKKRDSEGARNYLLIISN